MDKKLMKQIKSGNNVRVINTITGEWGEGVVIDLLSKQFTYMNEKGIKRFCFYANEWEITRAPTKS